MKPGVKSTEFWLTLAAVVAASLLSSGLFPYESMAVKILGIVSSVLGALGYTVARTSAKNAALRAGEGIAKAEALIKGKS